MSCEYCDLSKGKPILGNPRGTKVQIDATTTGYCLSLWRRRQNGKYRMEFESINFCPMCGRDFKEGV